MYQTWSWLGFLHWSYRPEVLQRLLPGGLRPPYPPWFTSFPETNVRTYSGPPSGP